MKSALYSELKLKIIVITLIVAIAPLIFLALAIFDQFAGLCEEQARDEIHRLARSQAAAIDIFLRERVSILTTLVDTIPYDELRRQESLAHLFEVINRRSDGLGLVDLGLIDSSGDQLAYIGPYPLRGLNYDRQSWFSDVMTKGRFISDVYLGYRQLPHFIIAVRGRKGNMSWVLRATIDSEVFYRLVRSVQTGETGDAYILNKQGVFQTRPRFEGQILTQSELVPKRFGQGTSVMEKINAEGNKKFFAGAWLKNNEWLLVIRQESCDEKGRLLEIRNRNVITIGWVCSAIILATILTTHMLVRRLERSDAEMSRMNAQLIQSDKLAALGKMAASIAHEINNPLAAIGERAGWMGDLLEDEKFRESENFREYRTSVDKIEQHVERARKITHNLLGFARRMEPRQENVNINDTVTQTISLLDNYSRSNNIDIQTRLADDLPIIASDQAQVQQVLLNLLTNAIDAIGRDGRIEVRSYRSQDRIHIEVKDDGEGIPKDRQKNVFDPFYSTKTAGSGTGLGLSISYSIIEKMGGTIRLESEMGKGSIFTVEIPIVTPERL